MTHIDKCIAYHQNVFVLVNKCSSQVNCEYSIHFSTTMSVIDVLHTHNICLGIRFSVRHIISYGVLTPADATLKIYIQFLCNTNNLYIITWAQLFLFNNKYSYSFK